MENSRKKNKLALIIFFNVLMFSFSNNTLFIALIIVIIALSVALATFIVLFSVSVSEQNKLKTNLENMYQQNFNELVDNVNNTEIKLSKIIVSDSAYLKKMLNEVSKNSAQASTSLSSLPVSINGIDETIKFINQVSGYTQSLANKLEKGKSLTQAEVQTLKDLKIAFEDLKNNINKLSKDIYNGNIYKESQKLDGDYNNFTLKLKNIKAGDVDYPTMIYDGPFSDSTINSKIKNLNFAEVSVENAKQNLKNIFTNIPDDNFIYVGETSGKFDTYNFEFETNDKVVYIQVTKNGGKLLTMSANDNSDEQNYTIYQAIDTAINFSKKCGIESLKCVWYDVVGGDAYINLAPTKNNIIMYPDLVKVKVDLSNGMVSGFEASPYYTNHIQRNLKSVSIAKDFAENLVPQGYKKQATSLCVVPLEFGEEELCYEIECLSMGDTYYIYVNALSGEIENVLKVIETDDGTLLM